MITLAIVNQKGGVAKSTTAVTLGHGLAIKGWRVLLVDVDPQAQLASLLACDHESALFNWLVNDYPLRDVVRTTRREHLFLLPGDKRTASAQVVLTFEQRVTKALQAQRDSLKTAGFDAVIFDTAPSVGGLQDAALLASDWVIVPAATDYLSSEGVTETLTTLEALREEFNWRGRIMGILPTFYDEVTKESAAILANLRQSYGDDAVLQPIHRATILRECAAEGLTIWEKDPKSRAAQEYSLLVWRVYSGT